ncbi:MAG: HAD family hydrolase [Lachnospiraceae bacterium]
MITAVFFDIGGTIHTQDASPECDKAYAELLWNFLGEHGIQTEKSPDLLLPHINKGAKVYKQFAEKQMVELPCDDIWQHYMLKDFAIPAAKLQNLGEQLCYMYDRYRKKIVQRQGLHTTLETLKRLGYRLGVISNIMSITFVPRILKEYHVEHYFETVTLSSVCGIRKPRTEIFDLAISEMGVTRQEAAYVGDTLSRDVRGVRGAGWPLMIQIDNARVYHKDAAYKDFTPDIRISELPEVVPGVEMYNRKWKEG